MSGIEAIVGVTASGTGLASLAIQLAESAVKLKRFYHTAKNAPETLNRIVFDLDTMSLALRQLKQLGHHEDLDTQLLSRCILQCQQCTEQIREVVNRLLRNVDRRVALGKTYAALKQPEVDRMLDDFRASRESLMLAVEIYHQSWSVHKFAQHTTLLQEQARILASHGQVLRILSSPIQPGASICSTGVHCSSSQGATKPILDIHPGTLVQQENGSPRLASTETRAQALTSTYQRAVQNHTHMTTRRRHKRGTKTWQLTVRLPNALGITSRVWTIAAWQSYAGWHGSFQMYNARPEYEEVFLRCKMGDLAGMQRLATEGRASPLDLCIVREHGISYTKNLLEIAAQHGHFDTCRWLLEAAIWPDQQQCALDALNTLIRRWAGTKNDRPMIYRFFLETCEVEIDLAERSQLPAGSPFTICPNTDCLAIVLRNQNIPIQWLSFESRLELAGLYLSIVRIASRAGDSADMIFQIVGKLRSDPALATLRAANGLSIMHLVASGLARRVIQGKSSDEWLDAGRSLLANGANPFLLAAEMYSGDSRHLVTPLLSALVPPTCFLTRQQRFQVLRSWVAMLGSAGIDLQSYGQAESLTWADDQVRRCEDDEQGDFFVEILYGPSVEDWNIVVEPRTSLQLYSLHSRPGAFPRSQFLPNSLCWKPIEHEREEGDWIRSSTVKIKAGSVKLDYQRARPQDPARALLNATQDDASPLSLMVGRSRRPSLHRRCSSQPPSLNHDHFRVDYGNDITLWDILHPSTRSWIQSYHRCLWDGQICLIYRQEGEFWTSGQERPRDCAQGLCERDNTANSLSSRLHNFMADMRYCRLREVARCYHSPSAKMKHTGTRSCPQGCGRASAKLLGLTQAQLDLLNGIASNDEGN